MAARLEAAPQAAGLVEIVPATSGVTLRSGRLTLQVTALRDDIVRVRVGRDGHLPEDASWAVLPTRRGATVETRPLAQAGASGFRTRALSVKIDPRSLRLTVTDAEGRILVDDAPTGSLELGDRGFTLRKTFPDGERFYGLGDKAGPLDRRGQAFSMWNTDAFGYQAYSDPLYKSIPFFLGVSPEGRSYGVLVDTTWRSWFDFGRTDPSVLTIGAADGPLDYYVMAGPTPKDVVKAYGWLTGPSPLPPLWSLGFQQSRYSYMSAAEVRSIADRLRAEKIPADVIYLDIDYQDRNRPFTVNTATFPDLPKLASDLRGEGFRLVAITDLHIAKAPGEGYAPYDTGLAGDHFVKAADGKTFVGAVWPGPSVFPDFTRAASRAWWGGLYKDFQAAGIAGFWNDMNEPAVFNVASKTLPLDAIHRIDEPGFATRTATHAEIHNVFGMENSRATYEGLLALAPAERPHVLTRASYAGGQRYAATWTGDNSATWSHLALSIPMQLNLGLSGFAWSGADVGGYAGSPSPDLLTRWLEIGAFTPLFRDHSGKGTARHEPWVDGRRHTDIRRRYIEERYRLMPYLYALADEASRTGLPVMRPVMLEFPAAPEARGASTFLLGPDLLIAPPTEGETLDRYQIDLPGSGWFDYWTGRRVLSSHLSETPTLERLPVFVRGGTILPRQPLVQSTAETPNGPLELRVYPGANCQGDLYWDDGHSIRRDAAAVLRQHLRCETTPQGVALRFDPREGGFAPWWRSLDVAVYGWSRPTAVARLNGQVMESRVDAAAGVVHVALPDQAGAATLTVE